MTSVALLRIPTAEVSLLRNVFAVVATRGLNYEIAETREQSAKSDIVFVDADNPMAAQLWTVLKQQQPHLSGILVTRKPPQDDEHFWVQRPLNSIKILTALGKIDVKRNPQRTERRSVASGPAPFALKGLHVLVIDDSATVRKQLELALTDQGIHVQTAETGELGMHMLLTRHFDLVFLDVVLPGADGYQICKTLKRNKLKQRIPVVMLTSKSSPFDRIKGSLAGCDTYLTKPVELQRLTEVLQKHLTRRPAVENNAGVSAGDIVFDGATTLVRAAKG